MPVVLRKYGLFLLIPGILLVFAIFLKIAAGPYWLATNLDPSYQYLVNGLYLLKGLVPNHTDHPGTPLQILCALTSWLFNLGRSKEDLIVHVLHQPEFYLHAVFILLTCFTFVTSVCLGAYVFYKTGDWVPALLAQLPAFSFLVLKSWETPLPVLPVVANLSPEPFLIGILNVFNICLLMNCWAKTSREELVSCIVWGFVCGLGAAVKLTFVPILIIPFIVLSWRNKILFAAAVAISFVAWTFPILSKYHIITGWISGIIMHQRAYGASGTGGMPSFDYWTSIVIGQWPCMVFLLGAVVLLIWKILRKEWGRESFFLAAVWFGIFFHFSAVSQHPGAHYLLPGLSMFSALLVLFYRQIFTRHVWASRIAGGIIAVTVLLGIGEANAYRLKLDNLTQEMLHFHDHAITEYPNCIFVDYYRSSGKEAALFFGDGWNESPQLGPALAQIYPDKFYFHIWEKRILNFNGEVWSNDILAQNPCVIFRGDGNFDFTNSPYDVRLLEKGRVESIHLLTGTTEKQAATLLAASMKFYQGGDMNKAMALALEARKLHYQPDSTTDDLIKLYGVTH